MNFYEHHIGDYIRDTAHLSALEDCFYRRAIDFYYANEQPLPLDFKKVTRLLRARSKDEIAALQAILDEFFNETVDGYRQTRCDAEIAKYHEALPEIEAKKENTKERQRRTRENRKLIFAVLRDNGIVPPYDAPMSQLKQLVKPFESQLSNALVTRDMDVTLLDEPCDATANQVPLPTTHINIHTQSAGDPDLFLPNLEKLNIRLKGAGHQPIDQASLDKQIGFFNDHYETWTLTENQKLSKLAQWVIKQNLDDKSKNNKVRATLATGAVNQPYAEQILQKPASTPESEAEWARFQAECAAEDI